MVQPSHIPFLLSQFLDTSPLFMVAFQVPDVHVRLLFFSYYFFFPDFTHTIFCSSPRKSVLTNSSLPEYIHVVEDAASLGILTAAFMSNKCSTDFLKA